ncbi:GLPGLI family protein [Flavobacteriaceae bacterium]|nr:GLPGLI family protein [Flavobacteriaceae bacterium]MDB2632241.1 GLPGLI family protein [Flavobacteriaceae bacterium]
MTLKRSIILTLLISSAFVFAQDFQGKAYYMSKTNPDLDSWGGQQMSEAQKKQIMERMRSMFEKTYILTFDKVSSIFKEEEVLEAPGQRGFGMWGNSFSAGPQYKNVKTQQFIQDQEFFGRQFLITDSLQKLDWKLGTETKQIGQYLCMKATATKTVDEFDWRSMRRRDRNNQDKATKTDSTKTTSVSDEIEVPKTIEITAWYTLQIPVNQGPGEYWGLPGLILEVNADRTTILCSKITMNPQQKIEIEAPEKGKVISRTDYNATVKKKMEEMREMYRGRGGRGRGRN